MSASFPTPLALRHTLIAALLASLAGCNAFDTVRPDAPQASSGEFVGGEILIGDATPATSPRLDNAELAGAPVEMIDDLWERIRGQLHMQTEHKREIEERITAQMQWFIDNPDYFERVSDRAEPFLYMIVSEIEQRGMPMEMALLPVVSPTLDNSATQAALATLAVAAGFVAAGHLLPSESRAHHGQGLEAQRRGPPVR